MAKRKRKTKLVKFLNKKGGFLRPLAKLSRKKALIIIASIGAVGAAAFAISHAATASAVLNISITGLPSGTSVTLTASGHDIGYCGKTIVVTGSKTCTSGPLPDGSGNYYPIGTTNNDTFVQIPQVVNAGGQSYVLSGGCVPNCGPIYVPSGGSQTLRAIYSLNAPANLTFNVTGVPGSVTFTATGHDIGVCGRSIVVSGSKTCTSGTNSTGAYYPIGTTNNDTFINFPQSVTVNNQTYNISSAPGACHGGTCGPIYVAQGGSSTLSFNYTTTAVSGSPARLSITVTGLPSGAGASFSANNWIGDCTASFTVSGTRACSSGPNNSGGYYPIGAVDNSTTLNWSGSITSGGVTYKLDRYCAWYASSCTQQTSKSSFYIAPGSSATISLSYIKVVSSTTTGTTPPTSTAEPATFAACASTYLRIGSTGSCVKLAQDRLVGIGYGVPQDSIYGSGTASGVTQFQCDKGFTVDGVVGPQTWGGLSSTTSVITSHKSCAPLSIASSGRQAGGVPAPDPPGSFSPPPTAYTTTTYECNAGDVLFQPEPDSTAVPYPNACGHIRHAPPLPNILGGGCNANETLYAHGSLLEGTGDTCISWYHAFSTVRVI